MHSMQMVRLNIKRQTPAVSKPVENVDLDEKIRRIREANRERERRFLEVEQDKKLASILMSSDKKSDKDTHKKVKKEQKHTVMKGVHTVNCKKRTTGRGQRLLEMSHHPLKAESFESRLKDRMRVLEKSQPDTITLNNKSRSSIREKIKTRNRVPVDANENVEKKDGDICSHKDKLKYIPEKEFETAENPQENEILLQQNEESNNIVNEFDNMLVQDHVGIESKENPANKTESNVAPSETNEEKIEEADLFLDSVRQKEQETIKESGTKNDQAKIRVDLKKTASSSSFDESIALLSPLDLPQNWGDLDYSDEELPSVSTWRT